MNNTGGWMVTLGYIKAKASNYGFSVKFMAQGAI
jgi:hypothetical protein